MAASISPATTRDVTKSDLAILTVAQVQASAFSLRGVPVYVTDIDRIEPQEVAPGKYRLAIWSGNPFARLTTYVRADVAARALNFELGMEAKAQEELGLLSAADALDPRVLDLRVQIRRVRQHWEDLLSRTATLCERYPDDPQWLRTLAFVTRHLHGPSGAIRILK